MTSLRPLATLALLLAPLAAAAQPASVSPHDPVRQFATANNPGSVYVGPDGRVYVAEHNASRLMAYQADGSGGVEVVRGLNNFMDYLVLPNGRHVFATSVSQLRSNAQGTGTTVMLKDAAGANVTLGRSLGLLASGNFLLSTGGGQTFEYTPEGVFVRQFAAVGGDLYVRRDGKVLISGGNTLYLFSAGGAQEASARLTGNSGYGVGEAWDGTVLAASYNASGSAILAFDQALRPLGTFRDWGRDARHSGFATLPDGSLLVATGTGVDVYQVNGSPALPIGAGRPLAVGQNYRSASGGHYLVFQTDGNLVVYATGHVPVWALNMIGIDYTQGARAAMEANGNLVVYNRSGGVLWQALPAPPPVADTRLVVANRGALILVSASGGPLWSSDGNLSLP